MTQEPVIYTSLGNVPVSTLDYKVSWEDKQTLSAKLVTSDKGIQVAVDRGGEITMVEEYFDKYTKECVKRSVHTHLFKGLDAESDSGNVG